MDFKKLVYINLALLLDSVLASLYLLLNFPEHYNANKLPLTFLLVGLTIFLALSILIRERQKLIKEGNIAWIQLFLTIISIILYNEAISIQNRISSEYSKISTIVFQGIQTAIAISHFQTSMNPHNYIFYFLCCIYLYINFFFTFEDTAFLTFRLLLFIFELLALYPYTLDKSLTTFFQQLHSYFELLQEPTIIFTHKLEVRYVNMVILKTFNAERNSIIQKILSLKVEQSLTRTPDFLFSPVSEDNFPIDFTLQELLKSIQQSKKETFQQQLVLLNSKIKHQVKLLYQNTQYESNFFLVLESTSELFKLFQGSGTVDVASIQEGVNNQVSKVSHEMRTPLNAIISMLECLEKDIDEYLKRTYLKPCLNSARLLLSLLNDILDHAQLRKNKLEANIISFSLKRLIEKAINIFEVQCRKRQIKIQFFFDNRIPCKVRSDQNRLRQIIINLLSNSIKFSKSGGNIKISCVYHEVMIRIGVKDDGVGIDKKHQQGLFQEFGKIVNPETRKLNSQGIGLGLQISQELAILLGPEKGGGLQIESNINEGAEFFFFLKNHQAISSFDNIFESDNSAQTIHRQKSKPARNLVLSVSKVKSSSSKELENSKIKANSASSFYQVAQGLVENEKKILVVDDNEFNILALTFQLEQLGFQSESCYTGKDAIKLIQQRKLTNDYFKIIFMDLEMPEMDGLETTKQILIITKQSFIVGCTGYSNERGKCLQCGMTDVVEKPVSRKALKQLLKKLMSKENPKL